MVGTIIGETNKEGQNMNSLDEPKKKMYFLFCVFAWFCLSIFLLKERELVPFVVGSYFTHGPFNVVCM